MDSLINWLVAKIFRRNNLFKGFSVSLYLVIDYFFDFVLYYIAIRSFGPLIGGGSVMLLGIIFDYSMLRLYIKNNRDIFGIEELKRLRDYSGENKFRIFISKIVKKGNLLALGVIAFYSNPCLATIYMRPYGEKRREMNYKDWYIFMFSACIEIVWILFIYGLVLIEKNISGIILN